MPEVRQLADTALINLIINHAALGNNARAAALLTNDTEKDFECIFMLEDLSYSGTPPTEGDRIGDLYVIPGNGEGTEVFPEGGDGTVGDDVDPQAVFLVGSFETRQPSDTVVEVLGVVARIYAHGNRIVVINRAGQSWDANWDLNAKPVKGESV